MASKVSRDGVTLVWQKPTTDGGSAIIGYLLEKRLGFLALVVLADLTVLALVLFCLWIVFFFRYWAAAPEVQNCR